MSIGLLFWILMIFWFVFGWVSEHPMWNGHGKVGHGVLLFILLFLLGWRAFGFVLTN